MDKNVINYTEINLKDWLNSIITYEITIEGK